MKNIKLNDILYSSIFMFIFFICMLFTESCLNLFPLMYKILKLVTYFMEFIVFIFYIFNNKLSKFCGILFLYILACIFSSLIGEEAQIMLPVYKYLPVLSFCFYLELSIRYNYKKTISILEIVFFIVIFINFLTLIVYPEGMYSDGVYDNNWFLKYDNQHIFIFIPGLVVSYINSCLKQRRIRLLSIIMQLMVMYSVFYCFSANSVVSYSILLLFLLVPNSIKRSKIFNISTYIFSIMIIFFSFVIFRVQNIFSWFIVDTLGKDITFTNRTFIWDKVIELVAYKPLWGYGYEGTETIALKLGSYHFTHAHNTILDILYKSGYIGGGLFLILIFIVVKQLHIYRKMNISKVISIGVFCLFLMMIFEARETSMGLYTILCLGNNCFIFSEFQRR